MLLACVINLLKAHVMAPSRCCLFQFILAKELPHNRSTAASVHILCRDGKVGVLCPQHVMSRIVSS